MNDTERNLNEREEALRRWREEVDEPRTFDRKFSGERLKRAIGGDRLTKGAFVLITAVVLFLVFSHDSKEARAIKSDARAAAQLDEPSVRDFRPPVMPARFATAQLPAATPPVVPKPEEKSTRDPQVDQEMLSKQRRAEQLEEARTKSDIMVRGGPSNIGAGAGSRQDIGALAEGLPPQFRPPGVLRSEQGSSESEDSNVAFSRQVTGHRVAVSVPRKGNDLQCKALQGKMLDAELETAINTDLPGQLRAIVSAPLYAEQGRQPLLTAGSRLVGVYNSAVRKGQVRVFAIWNRAIRPDGVEITLDSNATDTLGRSGMVGETDTHFVQTFGMSVLLSIIGAGTSNLNVGPDTRYNSADEYRRQVQQSFGRTADRVLGPYASIPPTNTVRQGTPIKVFLNRDLDFCPLNIAAHERRQLVLP